MAVYAFNHPRVCGEYLLPSPGGAAATPALRSARVGSCDQAERSACEDLLESPPLPSNERLELARYQTAS